MSVFISEPSGNRSEIRLPNTFPWSQREKKNKIFKVPLRRKWFLSVSG